MSAQVAAGRMTRPLTAAAEVVELLTAAQAVALAFGVWYDAMDGGETWTMPEWLELLEAHEAYEAKLGALSAPEVVV